VSQALTLIPDVYGCNRFQVPCQEEDVSYHSSYIVFKCVFEDGG
jgi:hypothetical protein